MGSISPRSTLWCSSRRFRPKSAPSRGGTGPVGGGTGVWVQFTPLTKCLAFYMITKPRLEEQVADTVRSNTLQNNSSENDFAPIFLEIFNPFLQFLREGHKLVFR